MTDIKDGGPAFPCDWKEFQPHTGEQVVREQFGGMSLRDWFAGLAMQAVINSDPPLVKNDILHLQERTAHWAYTFADAMLKERQRK